MITSTIETATSEQANIIMLIFAGAFFLVSIIFFTVSLITRRSHKKKTKNCTHMVTGDIIKYEEGSISSRISDAEKHQSIYYPVVEYTVKSKKYTLTYSYGKSKKGPTGPTPVRYNPDKPEEFYLPNSNTPILLYKIFIVASIACVVIGLTALITKLLLF